MLARRLMRRFGHCLFSSGTVDARGFERAQACSGDMFAGFTTTDANLLLGNTTFRISAEQVQPTQVHVIGVSPGNRGSVIQAASDFPGEHSALADD